MRLSNTKLVFDAVVERGPISRSTIATSLGLSSSAVSDLIGDLLETGFVKESGRAVSGGGRRPILLSASSGAIKVLGVDIRREAVSAYLCDPAGRVLAYEVAPSKAELGPHAVLRRAMELARSVLARRRRGELVGIGVSCSAPVDADNTVRFTDIPGWDEPLPVARTFEAAFGVPAAVENDANLGALAELRFGLGREHRHLVYVLVHTGVGAGIIVSRQLYRGSLNRAGELGHVVVDLSGELCDCGSYGCLETVLSTKALAKYWHSAVKMGRPSAITGTSAEEITDAALKGDAAALRAIEQLGEVLGVAFATAANLFSPEVVVLGGPLTRAGNLLLEPASLIARTRTRPLGLDGVTFAMSVLGEHGPALGATAYALDTILTRASTATQGARSGRPTSEAVNA